MTEKKLDSLIKEYKAAAGADAAADYAANAAYAAAAKEKLLNYIKEN